MTRVRIGSPRPRAFLNYWTARSPIGGRMVVCQGGVGQFRDGLICRNNVFFDMSPINAAIKALKAESGWRAKRLIARSRSRKINDAERDHVGAVGRRRPPWQRRRRTVR